MNNPSGGLQIAANTTPSLANNTPAKHTQGWAAIAAGQHGESDVAASAANSRLTLQPGTYLVTFQASMQGEDVSGTAGDGIGNVSAQLYKDQAAIAGLKATLDTVANEQPGSMSIVGIVEVAAGQNGQLEVYMSSGDAGGNDITITEAQFSAVRLR